MRDFVAWGAREPSSREVVDQKLRRIGRDRAKLEHEARRHRVVLDLSAQAYALFRDAKTELVKATGHGLDDDAFITLLTRALLLAQPPQGGETEVGSPAEKLGDPR